MAIFAAAAADAATAVTAEEPPGEREAGAATMEFNSTVILSPPQCPQRQSTDSTLWQIGRVACVVQLSYSCPGLLDDPGRLPTTVPEHGTPLC